MYILVLLPLNSDKRLLIVLPCFFSDMRKLQALFFLFSVSFIACESYSFFLNSKLKLVRFYEFRNEI